jgi:hypothetical protein
MGRTVVFVLVAAAAVVSVSTLDGSPRLGAGDVIERLASRAEVGERFEDAEHGRFDATVFVFTAALAAPFVLLALLAMLALGHLALEATVLPVGRWVGVPDGVVVATVTLLAVAVAYAQADLWLPRSLTLLGLIARAWVVSTT